MTFGYNRNCQQFPHILGHCDKFFSHSVLKNLTRGPSLPKSHTGAKNQTDDNSKYTIFYLAKGFEGLYLECNRNPTKLPHTLKIILKIV